MFLHTCQSFKERPYFGLIMFFCICPACLPVGQKQKAKEFGQSLLPIIFTDYKCNRQNKNNNRKMFLCKVIQIPQGTIFWLHQQHHEHSHIPWFGLAMPWFWTHHKMVLDCLYNISQSIVTQ